MKLVDQFICYVHVCNNLQILVARGNIMFHGGKYCNVKQMMGEYHMTFDMYAEPLSGGESAMDANIWAAHLWLFSALDEIQSIG